jgi:uncharacterized protein (TIGR02996 family)
MISPAECEAFMRSIIADPDDDLARLVFADRLDEEGDPQGDFIRVQCEIPRQELVVERVAAGHPGDDITAREEDKLERLRRRERELLTPSNRTNWGWLCPTDHTREVFRRGFPCELSLPWDDWRRHSDQILAAAPIRRVDRAPRRACPQCDGDKYTMAEVQVHIERETCAHCRGTGTLPADTPDWRGDGLVRLTTWPDGGMAAWRFRSDGTYTCADFPGVHFELPPRRRGR